jgi:DNA-binding NtrC family response regulator
MWAPQIQPRSRSRCSSRSAARGDLVAGRDRFEGTVSAVHTQLFTDDASGELVERGFRLAVVGGPDAGLIQVLDEGTTMVGTHADNTIVLSDATVSRYHLEIRVRRDGVEVRDLETTNGTRHGGAKLGSVVLTGASRLRLGKHTEVDIEPVDALIALDDWHGDRFGDVLGATPIMKRLFAVLARVAPTEATVLLEGETGTGKEAMAEAIHRASARRNGPFIVVDCGVIPHELIASELFGHARGAYTGATNDKKGLIESANGGTLFLDEIGELALDLQPQLLRVLDRRQVRRVGENHAVDVDIRVVAATHRDLRAMVKAGTFREDLYYRLAVVRTTVPPLRERAPDIAALAAHFAAQHGEAELAISPALLDQLQRHPWPGNVRELRNVVERALSLGTAGLDELGVPASPATTSSAMEHAGAPGDPIAPMASGTPAEVLEMPFKEAKASLIESFERDYLTHLLARHRGNISRAAAEAGIDRNYIHRLVKKYGLEVDRG